MELRILILAPRGRDAEVAAGILTRIGLTCRVCTNLAELVKAAEAGAGAALVTEEALDGNDDVAVLLRWVRTQPPWSDFPFIVLATPRGDIAQGVRAPAWFEGIGNTVLLERPLGATALTSSLRNALRARRKQHEMRAYLAEREAVARRLAASNASLEARVIERTEELRAAYEQLKEEGLERERTEARLTQAQRLEALGKLAGGIAHDFNNVLQAVSGGLSLIQRRAGDADGVRRLAGMAADAANRGATITGRLLSFARRDALRAEAVSPNLLLEGLGEMLAHTLGVRIKLRVIVDEYLPMLLADKGQLETVLVNLAVNARDALPDGGALVLAATSEVVLDTKAHPAALAYGRYVRLSVSDTGTGMDAATLARASEPFFTTKPRGQGTGLGLAMARGFAQQSGGGLVIESMPGHGTIVTLWFPEAIDALKLDGQEPSINPPEPIPASAYVLVVDDDAMVREVLIGLMKEQGYHVSHASDGLEALAQLDNGAVVDLLLSDFSMPGMNGLTLIQEARRRRPALPAVLLTGFAEASLQFGIKDTDMATTALLRKPVSNIELTKRVDALLRYVASKHS